MAKSKTGGIGRRLNDAIALISPGAALRREKAIAERHRTIALAAHYEGAGRGRRGQNFRVNSSDAVESMRNERGRLSHIARDMLRNNPRVVKAEMMLVNQMVGAGIMPRVQMVNAKDTETKKQIEELIKAHCMSRDIDADGRLSLFGLQALIAAQVISTGEILARRRLRRASDGLTLPFQIQVLESDFLNEMVDGRLENNHRAVQGIEFDQIGRRVFYHLYPEHPGGRHATTARGPKVAALNMLHVFDQTRPGQVRGVSWFAPVLTLLHDVQSYQDAEIEKQHIASLFAGIYKPSDATGVDKDKTFERLEPGAILHLSPDDEMEFTEPPTNGDHEAFLRTTDSTIAAAMGLTYEGFVGSYKGVNFTGGRMGRMDTDPFIQRCQRHLMIDQCLSPIGDWIKEGIEDVSDIDADSYRIEWVPPRRPVIDPVKEYAAQERAMRAGLKSRRDALTEEGRDYNEVEAQILEERSWATENELVFSSDAGSSQSRATDNSKDDDDDEG